MILDPLFETLQPASVLMCWIDQAPDANDALPGGSHASVTTCRADELADAVGRDRVDVIWLRGYPNWHAVRALMATVAGMYVHASPGGGAAPVIVVECGPPDAVPLEQSESSKEGVRLALFDFARRLDLDATILWCAPGRGVGALVPRETVPRLQPWLDRCRVLLDALRDAHRESVELVARNFALFELLDQSQRDATAVVRSSRFRLGTRAVRLGRALLRKEAVFRPPGAILDRQPAIERWRSLLASDRRVGADGPRVGALRVTYVLPELRLSGGALVVMQLVNELRSLGVDARVVALRGRRDRRREVFRWRLQVQPLVFADAQTLIRELPASDVVVATHWTTAPWVRQLVDSRRAKHAAYFLQDYEPWFFSETDEASRARVKQTYDLIAHKIVTSDWLRDLLAGDGYPARTIPLGLDLGFFYPRPVTRPARPIVLAMARPRTPRRAFDFVVATLAKVHEAMPAAEIVLFGEQIASLELPFPYRSAGVITDQDELARLYSSAQVHFDGSDFQAFGLPALEAMGCGAVSVLTDAGGVREYARDDENCLLVPPRDTDSASRAILRLLSDDALVARLREAGFATARDHSMQREARETLGVLEEIAASVAPA